MIKDKIGQTQARKSIKTKKHLLKGKASNLSITKLIYNLLIVTQGKHLYRLRIIKFYAIKLIIEQLVQAEKNSSLQFFQKL